MDTFNSLATERRAAILRMQAASTGLSIQMLRLRNATDPEEAFNSITGPSKAATRAIDNCAAQIETITQRFQAEIDDAD